MQLTDFHTLDILQSLSVLETDADTGLGEEEAAYRLAQYKQKRHKNAKDKHKKAAMPEQLKEPSVLLLIVVSIVLAVIDDGLRNALLIITILAAGMLVSGMQKSRVRGTLRKIKIQINRTAKVKRDGIISSIDISKLVAGDIIYFDKGDIIPADLRIIESNKLLINEMNITGDDDPVRKETGVVQDLNATLSERTNLAYMGSTVTFGRGVGVVYAVGSDTYQERISADYTTGDDITTELQTELNKSSWPLSVLVMIICTVALITGILYEIFEIGSQPGITVVILTMLALNAAVTPGKLGNTAVVIMAGSVRKMSKTGNIVKNLRSALNLGSAAVICTNKTGTLTKNIMTITHVADSENIFEVTGIGYKPKGHVIAETMITRNIALMSEIVVLCNNADYDRKNAQIFGDPTEGAMLVYGAKLGHDKDALNALRPRIQEKPFDSGRKIMSTYNMDGERVMMYTKGAAEAVIARSTYVYLDGEIVIMSDTVRERLLAMCDNLASKSLRVMACAYKVYDEEATVDFDENDLIYVGTMGLADPLRDELKASIRQCKNAGLEVKLITGDHPETARAVAISFGITEPGEEIIGGDELDICSDEELQEIVKRINVFARVSPEHKLRIVSAIQAQQGHKVAMTGVDIDDLQALKKADISIAMGHSGKDIVREAADVILSDDNLANLISAVEEGKTIYSNIRKAVGYLLACKTGLLLTVVAAVFLGLPLPLTCAQLLIINLLCNALPVPAIGKEEKEYGVLAHRVRKPGELIINRRTLAGSIARGVSVFICAFAAFLYGMYVAIAPDGVEQNIIAASMCFLTLTAGTIIASYSAKTESGIWQSGTILKNRYINTAVIITFFMLTVIFRTASMTELFSPTALTAGQVTICLLLMILMTTAFEITKENPK